MYLSIISRTQCATTNTSTAKSRIISKSSPTIAQQVQVSRKFATATGAVAAKPKEDVNWDNLSFSLTATDKMYISQAVLGESFTRGKLADYGPIPLYPSATVLNYGQGIFEGLKAFRTSKGRIVIFRPASNWARMNDGAQNFSMPQLPQEVFFDGINSVVQANSHWVPPEGKGALYLRPIMFGDGAQLGVAPSSHYSFVVWASPVGPYFKAGTITPISLEVATQHHRAAPKGSGHVKAIGNYAPVFGAQQIAKKKGFQEVLFLDAKFDRFVEEAGASNFFCVTQDNVLRTPSLGAILSGVTRNTVLKLALDNGIKYSEEKLDIDTVLNAKEAFCTGTGASITPIGSITYKGKKIVFNDEQIGKITQVMHKTIQDIQHERIYDTHGWLHDPFAK